MTRVSCTAIAVLAIVLAAACAPAAPTPTAAPVKPASTSAAAAQPAAQPAAPAAAPEKPAAKSEPVAASPDWQTQWNQTLAAAKQEKTLVFAGTPGAAERKALVEAFNEKYPDIQVEFTPARGTQIVAKMAEEYRAGMHAWDLLVASTNPTIPVLVRQLNAMRPMQEALILPETMDDSKWMHGFNAGFTDSDGKYMYGPFVANSTFLHINLEYVPEGAIKSLEDLKDPKWAGKISWDDPRMPGNGVRQAIRLSLEKGDDWLRDLFQRQQILYVNDDSQRGDWFVRGRAPIAIGGILESELARYQEQGLAKRVQRTEADFTKGFGGAGGNTQVIWFKNAPHPNAAKVYLNWYLSQEGQLAVSQILEANSRRLDVPPVRPDDALDPNREYINPNNEAMTPLSDRLYGLAKESIK